jgi:O-antigen ligase
VWYDRSLLSLLARLGQAARWALAALALAAAASVFSDPYFQRWIPIGTTVIALAAIARPREALIAIAAIGPLINLVAVAAGWPQLRAIEALVLAFIAGWLIRPRTRPAGPMLRRIIAPAGILIVLLVTSSASLVLELHRTNVQQFDATMAAVGRWYLWTADVSGIIAAAMIVEGLALMIAVVDLAEERPRLALALIDALAVGGVAAALLSILLASGWLPDILLTRLHLPSRRFAAHVTDVNAAGSYFAMLIGVACGMAASTIGARRRAWIGAVALFLTALVLSGSRSALVGALIVPAGGAWIAAERRLRIARRTAWGVAAIVGVLAAIVFARTSLTFGSGVRQEFTITSLRMLEARPIFGVGIGRYYDLSQLILTPRLGVLYAFENAHDYFLQIAAELGVAGLVAFVWVLAAALKPAVQTVSDRSRDFVSAGLLVGAAAFLITTLTGHPFLVREAAFPFWMVLGLAIVASRPASTAPRRDWTSRVALIVSAILLVSLPLRPDTPRLRLRPSQDGFGPWRTEGEGRVHDMGAFGALYVGPQVTGVEISMRLAGGNRHHPPMLVLDQEPGWSQHWTVVGPDWVTVRATLPGAGPLMAYQRINLSVVNRDESPPADPDAPLIDVRDLVITTARP